MKHYNTYVTSHLKVNVEALAVITQSMEDDVKPHIDIYRMAISQALLGAGVTGDLNHVIAMASTIDMLCQMSKITIRDFQDAVLRIAPITCNPLRWLSVDKAMHLARQLTGTLTPKDAYVNLNEIPMVETAFQAIANKLLSPEVFEKAFNEAETIN